MILARLLSPSDYGVVAMAAVVTSLLTIFVNCGFSMALIQKKDMHHVDACSVFYFNVGISIVIYAVLYFTAPLIAEFFNVEALTSIVRISALSLIIGSFGAVQGTLFTKDLDFKRPTIRTLVVLIISSICGVILAYMGFGYWALVYQTLLASALTTIINWSISSWKPTLAFSASRLRSMFGYGGNLMLKSIGDFGFAKIYDVVIGRFYTPADLSYYNRANSTQGLFTDTFLMTLNNVAFPAFSKIQDNKEKLRTGIIRFFLIETLVISFVMAMVIALASPIFNFLYSSKWDMAIPLFRIICIWGLFRPISCVFANGLMAHGNSRICLINSLWGRGMNVVFLIVTWQFGLEAMVIGQLCAYLIEIVLYANSFNRIFNYPFFNMLKDIAPYYGISAAIGILVYVIDRSLFSQVLGMSEFANSALRLLVGSVLGIVAFLQIYKRLKPNAFCDLLNLLDSIGKENIIVRRLTALVF